MHPQKGHAPAQAGHDVDHARRGCSSLRCGTELSTDRQHPMAHGLPAEQSGVMPDRPQATSAPAKPSTAATPTVPSLSPQLRLADPEASPELFIRPSLSDHPEAAGERASRKTAGGELVRLARGVYLPRRIWTDAPPWKRYEMAIAAKAHSHPGAVFRREAALVLWRLPLLRTPREITLRALGRSTAGRVPAAERGGVEGFDLCRSAAGPMAPSTLTSSGILPAVRGPEQGYRVEELIPVLTDTVPRMSRAAGVVVLDAVLAGERRPGSPGSPVQQAGGLARGLLHLHAEQMRVKRHRRLFLEALEFADHRSESAGESLLRVIMADLGFPAPALQSRIETRGRRYWVDFDFEEAGVVVEFDGLGKYRGGGVQAAGAEAAEAVIREKQREDDIRSTGRRVLRFVWADCRRPERIEAALLRAGVPQDRARRRAPTSW